MVFAVRRGPLHHRPGPALPLPHLPAPLAHAVERAPGAACYNSDARASSTSAHTARDPEAGRVANHRTGKPAVDAAFRRHVGRAVRRQQGIGRPAVSHVPRWRIAAAAIVLAALLAFTAMFAPIYFPTSNCRISYRGWHNASKIGQIPTTSCAPGCWIRPTRWTSRSKRERAGDSLAGGRAHRRTLFRARHAARIHRRPAFLPRRRQPLRART